LHGKARIFSTIVALCRRERSPIMTGIPRPSSAASAADAPPFSRSVQKRSLSSRRIAVYRGSLFWAAANAS